MILILFILLSVPLTAQEFTFEEVVGTYHLKEIASGDYARVDRANEYTTIYLKEDGSCLYQHQEGRITARFRYKYGKWELKEGIVHLNYSHEFEDYARYNRTNNTGDIYGNRPYDKKHKKEPRKSSDSFQVVPKEYDKTKIEGISRMDILYERVNR